MTATQTDKSTLIQFNGFPVPWVTRWTGQVPLNTGERLTIGQDREGFFVEYQSGANNRDQHGFLWQREGLNRTGEPEYSQVSTYRQRTCMTRRRCQVCGSHIESDVINWLLSKAQLEHYDSEVVTMSPPTCDGCIPIALDLCPHLKKGYGVLVKVLDYEPWGISGEGFVLDEAQGVQRANNILVPYDGRQAAQVNNTMALRYSDKAFVPRAVIAKQMVVRFNKYVIQESV